MRHPPPSEWNGASVNAIRLVKLVSCLLLSIGFLVVSVVGIVSFRNHRTQSRAESLLRVVRDFRIGETSLAVARPILAQFDAKRMPAAGWCAPDSEYYSIKISDDSLDTLAAHHPILNRLGAHSWGAVAVLGFSNDQLCAMSYHVSTVTGRVNGLMLTLDVETRAVAQGASNRVPYEIEYRVPHVTGGDEVIRELRITIAPDASQDERRKAFDYDLSCFATRSGCRAYCEIAPQASLDALRLANKGELQIPIDQLQNPNCKRAR